MADLGIFKRYYQLADQLIAGASKEEVAEVARLLALNIAHYQSKFGELPLEEVLTLLNTEIPNDEQAALLTTGMETLVGILGIVRSSGLDISEPLH